MGASLQNITERPSSELDSKTRNTMLNSIAISQDDDEPGMPFFKDTRRLTGMRSALQSSNQKPYDGPGGNTRYVAGSMATEGLPLSSEAVLQPSLPEPAAQSPLLTSLEKHRRATVPERSS